MPSPIAGLVRDLWAEQAQPQDTIFTRSVWSLAQPVNGMRRELSHRATLIQNIGDWYAILQPHAQPIFELYASEGLSEESIWEWIIAEELELVYGLFDGHHQDHRARDPHRLIHNALDAALPFALSRYTSHYIKAPKVYGDENEISIELLGIDLYIDYYRSPFQPLEATP